MGIIILLLILAFIAYVIWNALKDVNSQMPEFQLDHFNHLFPDLKFSAMEFYESVEKVLKEQQVPDIATSRVRFSEYGEMLDNQRTYLRVRNGRLVFDICAAPYGTGFFVSYWLGENVTIIMRILFRIPLFGTYFKSRIFRKTYYGLDNQDMFLEAARRAFMQAVDAVTAEKGIRALSESERKPKRVRQ